MITIRVPATTANLGSGFDVFGLTLNLYNEITFEKSDAFKLVNFKEKYNNEDNLILTTYKKIFYHANMSPIPVTITMKQNIPNCGGLGSSAACIVASIMAANYYLGSILTKEEIILLATNYEGHPDNVTPCVLGGAVASCKTKNRIISYKYKVNTNLKFVLIAPPFSLSTEKMRQLLPEVVKLSDAVFNISRSSLLPKALEEGNLVDLVDLCDDMIHQKYRISSITGAEEIFAWCKKNSLPCMISGSGSAILVITDDYEKVKSLPTLYDRYYLECDNEGAKIL